MKYDVCIVGVGTAGAAVALQCARRGLSTLGIERKSLESAGAHWVNGVALAAFDRAEIPRPQAPELRGGHGKFHLVCGWGPERLSLSDECVVEVDMRHLVARLQRDARAAGAELRSGVRAERLQGETLHTDQGPIEARYFVDASGLSGVDLLRIPEVPRDDLCAAAQEVRLVTDRAAAERYFEQHGAAPNETLCFTGVAGGYSILNLRLHGDEISILTGSLPSLGHASGKRLLDDFVTSQAWVGERVFGGARAIPLRAPRGELTRGNVAAIGDSVSQVFAAHGSGIAVQLESSKILAEAIALGDLHEYSRRWQARYGLTFRIYDLFRRFSQTLTPDELAGLLRSGLLDEKSVLAGLHQELPKSSLSELGAKLPALWEQRWIVGRALSVALRELA
ncbi:MAG: NAD(P)/FAD-dependent oxidoreductase [Polyangiaceae bacterium]|nr:NAD(P)/FAD-dependent oxidoreductase [Polyangiaceae bacterium]